MTTYIIGCLAIIFGVISLYFLSVHLFKKGKPKSEKLQKIAEELSRELIDTFKDVDKEILASIYNQTSGNEDLKKMLLTNVVCESFLNTIKNNDYIKSALKKLTAKSIKTLKQAQIKAWQQKDELIFNRFMTYQYECLAIIQNINSAVSLIDAKEKITKIIIEAEDYLK